MRLQKKKRKTDAFEKLRKICPDIKRGDIVAVFEFNLHHEIPGRTVDGIISADREYVTTYLGGEEINKVKISNVKSFKSDNGVGTVFVSYTLQDGSEHLLCIGDMSCSKHAIEAVKRINRIIEFGIEYYDKIRARQKGNGENAGERRVCSKCGRPLPRGSEKCPRCTNKFKNLIRLWNIIKPYKWFVILSVILFVVVSGLNLISPEISKIVTDDYINAKNPATVEANQYVLMILLMLGVQMLLRAISMFRSHALILASNSMIVDLRNMLFEKIQRLSIEKISKRTAGELMRRVSHDVGTIQNFLVHTFEFKGTDVF